LLGAERAGFVGLVVESEEALNAEVAASEDFLVQVRAKLLKFFQAIGHGFSPRKDRPSMTTTVPDIMNVLRAER